VKSRTNDAVKNDDVENAATKTRSTDTITMRENHQRFGDKNPVRPIPRRFVKQRQRTSGRITRSSATAEGPRDVLC